MTIITLTIITLLGMTLALAGAIIHVQAHKIAKQCTEITHRRHDLRGLLEVCEMLDRLRPTWRERNQKEAEAIEELALMLTLNTQELIQAIRTQRRDPRYLAHAIRAAKSDETYAVLSAELNSFEKNRGTPT